MTDVLPVQPVTPPAVSGGVGVDTSRLASRANLDQAGKQFEAVFTAMMVKAMRSTHLSEDLFGSKATDTFKEMQDTQLARAMAEHTPLGIGKAMTDFLGRSLSGASAPGSLAGVTGVAKGSVP